MNRQSIEGWKIVRFGDIAYEVADRIDNPSKSEYERFVGLEHFDSGSLIIKRWESTKNVISAMKLFKKGDVLFARRNAYLKRSSMVQFGGICSGDAFVLRQKPDIIVDNFLPLILNTEGLWDYAISNAAGSMSKRVKWRDLANYEFPLPPAQEQKRIVDILWAVEENIRKWEDSLDKAKVYKKVLMKHLFTYGLVGVDDIGKLKMKKTEVGMVPACWEVATIGQSCHIDDNFRCPINEETRKKIKGKYPYYGPTKILDYINEYRVNGKYALIGEDGDHFLKFKTSSMTQLVQGKFNVNNHAHLIRGGERCLTEWVFYFFKHRDIRSHLTRQGAGRLKLTKDSLTNFLYYSHQSKNNKRSPISFSLWTKP